MWGLELKIETRKFQKGSWKSIIFMSIFKYVQNWWFQIIHQVSYKKIFEQGDKLNAEKRKTTPLCFFIIIPLDDFSLQVYSCFIGEVWQRPPNLISENPFVAGKRSQMKSTYGPHYTGKGLQFFFFWVSHINERHILIPHMSNCRKSSMTSLIQDDLLGLDTVVNVFAEGRRRPLLEMDGVHKITFLAPMKIDSIST